MIWMGVGVIAEGCSGRLLSGDLCPGHPGKAAGETQGRASQRKVKRPSNGKLLFLRAGGWGWGWGFFCKEGKPPPPPPPQGPSTNVPAPSARLAPLQTYWDVTRDLVHFLPEGEPRGKGQKRWVTGSAPTPSP